MNFENFVWQAEGRNFSEKVSAHHKSVLRIEQIRHKSVLHIEQKHIHAS